MHRARSVDELFSQLNSDDDVNRSDVKDWPVADKHG